MPPPDSASPAAPAHDTFPPPSPRFPDRVAVPLTLPDSTLDQILTAQLAVAWAGEGGDEPRLGWWRTFMVHEDGGRALFADLTPSTAAWVVFQGAREAARRSDAALRGRAHDPDRLYTLFRFGFEIDERVDERLLDHKRAGSDPLAALPGLRELVGSPWSVATFSDWVAGHGTVATVATPAGRRITGAMPADPGGRARNLVAALDPIGGSYSLPHYTAG